jgi:hypothetical protein
LKYKSAIEGREHSKAAFKELNANVDKVSLAEWQEEERKAIEKRGKYLKFKLQKVYFSLLARSNC